MTTEGNPCTGEVRSLGERTVFSFISQGEGKVLKKIFGRMGNCKRREEPISKQLIGLTLSPHKKERKGTSWRLDIV